MKTILLWIASMFATLALYVLMTHQVMADDRIKAIEQAWNVGDVHGVQNNFSRADADIPTAAFASARIANEAENGQTIVIRELKRLGASPYGVYAANALLDGKPVIWVFAECKDSTQFCWWMQRIENRQNGIVKAAMVDAGTTGIGLATGLAEGNPVGLVGATVIKGAIIANVRNVPFEQCVSDSAAADLVWSGAGVANVLTLMGAPLGVSMLGMAGYAAVKYNSALETAILDCAGYQFNNK